MVVLEYPLEIWFQLAKMLLKQTANELTGSAWTAGFCLSTHWIIVEPDLGSPDTKCIVFSI